MFRNSDGFGMGRGTLESLGEPLRLGIFHHGKDRGDFPLSKGLIGLLEVRNALSPSLHLPTEISRGGGIGYAPFRELVLSLPPIFPRGTSGS